MKEQKDVLDKYDGDLTLSALNEMVLLHASVKEVLRLFPPLIILARTAQKTLKYKDYSIPKVRWFFVHTFIEIHILPLTHTIQRYKCKALTTPGTTNTASITVKVIQICKPHTCMPCTHVCQICTHTSLVHCIFRMNLKTYHQHTINTPSTHHQHTINTPPTHHQHTINTPSTHHQHTINTQSIHHHTHHQHTAITHHCHTHHHTHHHTPSHTHHHTRTITDAPSHTHHHTRTITHAPSHTHHHTRTITHVPSHTHTHTHTITHTITPPHITPDRAHTDPHTAHMLTHIHGMLTKLMVCCMVC